MEARKESRLKVSQPVALTVLGVKVNHVIEACLVDMSGSGLQLRVPTPVPCGTRVKIDGNNTLMLGEVCRCEPEDGAYTVGVQLSQTLSSLTELELVNGSLIGEGRPKIESDSESRFSGR